VILQRSTSENHIRKSNSFETVRVGSIVDNTRPIEDVRPRRLCVGQASSVALADSDKQAVYRWRIAESAERRQSDLPCNRNARSTGKPGGRSRTEQPCELCDSDVIGCIRVKPQTQPPV
jgi:hypothetical protein